MKPCPKCHSTEHLRIEITDDNLTAMTDNEPASGYNLPPGCASCRGEKAPGTYMTGRVPAVPGFGNVLRVDAGFGCAGTEMHTHGDRRIRFCQVCGREL